MEWFNSFNDWLAKRLVARNIPFGKSDHFWPLVWVHVVVSKKEESSVEMLRGGLVIPSPWHETLASFAWWLPSCLVAVYRNLTRAPSVYWLERFFIFIVVYSHLFAAEYLQIIIKKNIIVFFNTNNVVQEKITKNAIPIEILQSCNINNW